MATLGSLLGKKKEDETQKVTLGSLLSKYPQQNQKAQVAPMSMGVSQSTPQTFQPQTGNPANLAKTIVQAPGRAAVATGFTLAQQLGDLTGRKTLTEYTPTSPFSKAVYGSEPIKSLQVGAKEFNIENPNIPTPLVALGFAASTALDLTPIGGTEKNALRALSRVDNVSDAATIGRQIGVAEDLIPSFSETISKIKDEATIKRYLDSIDETMKTTKPTQGATPQVQKIQTPGSTPLRDPVVPLGRSQMPDASLSSYQIPKRINQSELTQEIYPYNKSMARKKDLINIDRISVGDNAAGKILSTLEDIRPELEEAKGKPLTNAEVLKAAQSSEVLTKATSREATLKSEAALLATRQSLAAMAEGKGVSKDFIDQLRIVSQEATRRGRELQALGIGADPIARSSKAQLVQELLDIGVDTDELMKAAENVDFNNLKQVTAFYRAFVKPTLTERIDEFRYINLLSSPKTHIVNAFSNALQATILNPATRLATGAIDFVMSGLTGAERKVYMKEVAPYGKGVLNAVPKASRSFYEALKGNIYIERPDMGHLPTGWAPLKPFQVIPRTLEGMDVFFRTLIESGEKQAIAARYKTQGKELTDTVLAKIDEEAKKTAEYYVFRGALDASNKTGQGHVLSAIDKATSAVYQFRNVPGVKWFIPFVQTPMNILKQGLEYSPLGLATLPGAANKQAQVAKSLIGSMVFLGAGSLALEGKVTWAIPTSAKEKDAFYNSGRQPYSVKIGENWVSFSKLGPLAYPMAMAAALQWYTRENPKAVTQSSFERSINAMQGIAQFFSDQSYMQGMKSLIDFASGESKLTGVQSAFSSSVGQLVPLASLLRWTNQIIDPVYRRPDSEFNVGNLMQSIYKDIPGLSTVVPEIEGSLGRPNPGFNAISPIQVNPARKRYDSTLRQIRSKQRTDARLQAIRDK